MSWRFLAACLFGATLAAAAAPARASQDAVQFFRNIDVTSDTPVHDAICFFCSVRAQGTVEGDIVVFFGNVRLNGEARHDLVDFFGKVSAADNSSIGGDLVSFFSSVRLGENVSVAKDMVTMFGVVHAPASVSVGKDRVEFSPWIFFGPLLVILLAVIVILYAVRAHHRRQFTQGYRFPPQR